MEQVKPIFALAAIASVLIGSLATGAALTWRPARPGDAARAAGEQSGYTDNANRDAAAAPEVVPADFSTGVDQAEAATDPAMAAADTVQRLKEEMASTPDAFNNDGSSLIGGPLGNERAFDAGAGDPGFGSFGGSDGGESFGGGEDGEDGENGKDGEREGRRFRDGGEGFGGFFGSGRGEGFGDD